MILHDSETSKWFDSLDDVKPEYIPVKATSMLQFYKLDGRKSIISRDNFVPITYLQYVYFSPAENRYYLKTFGNYEFNECYYFNELYDVFGRNILIEQLRTKVLHGHGVWLLFTKHQISEVSAMLERVWNANRSEKGKLSYLDFLALAELTLKKDEFESTQKGLTGYKSVLNGMEEKIKELWKNAKNQLK